MRKKKRRIENIRVGKWDEIGIDKKKGRERELKLKK